MEFVVIPVGHAGTTLTRTLDHLIAVFSSVRPKEDHTSGNTNTLQTITVSTAMSHDYCLFKSLLGALTDLAQSRVLGIIKNMKCLV